MLLEWLLNGINIVFQIIQLAEIQTNSLYISQCLHFNVSFKLTSLDQS